jgi:alkylated DNA repair dioxygenase AlkB
MMELFHTDTLMNLLPHDGEVNYYGKVFTPTEAQYYYERLLNNIEWQNDEAFIFGKHFVTKRKAAWYAESNYAYTYSNATKYALPWTMELVELKSRTEKLLGERFNSCLLNLYHNGQEGMAYHSDDEKTLSPDAAIASLSFGAARKFLFKHKQTKQTISMVLETGSLLVMKGTTQANWLHRLPPTTKISQPRINLTFRTIQTNAMP